MIGNADAHRVGPATRRPPPHHLGGALLNFNQLRYFICTAEQQSFNRAATILNIGQPNLSRHIQQLERMLGVALFDRTARGATLTAAGKAFAGHARRLLDDLSLAQAEAGRIAKGEIGNLSLGIADGALNCDELGEMLSAFRRQYPETHLRMRFSSPLEQLEALQRQTLDIGCLMFSEPIVPPGIELCELHPFKVRVCMREDHPLAGQESISIDQLRDERFVWAPAWAQRPGILAACLERGFAPRIGQEATGLQALMLVRQGFGVAFMNEGWGKVGVAGLVLRPLEDLNLTIGVYLAWRADCVSPALQRFLELRPLPV